MPPAGRLEIEYKLRAARPLEVAAVDARLREAGVPVRSATFTTHTDLYLDDANGSLARAGTGLRLRRGDRGGELTCKARAAQNGARFERTEIVAEWPDPGTPQFATQLPELLRDAVEPYVCANPLVVVMRLDVVREHRVLQHDGRDACELAIDRVTAHAGARSARFEEIELEALGDSAFAGQVAGELAHTLALEPATTDKPGHAAALLGMRRPTTCPEALRPDEPAGRAVARAVEGHLATLQAAEAKVRQDPAPEHVHAVRVALRRLRSIVQAFAELWPIGAADSIRARLAAVSRRFGAVRDLDVLAVGLESAAASLPGDLRSATAPVAEWLEREHAATRAHLVDWLRSTERLAEHQALLGDLRTIATGSAGATMPLADLLRPRLQHAAASVRKKAGRLSDDPPLADLHRLRLANKRLRYLCEDFGRPTGLVEARVLRRVVRLQQVLGDVCDHELASQRLLALVDRPASATAASLAALGGLATWHAAAARDARQAALARCRRASRKRTWRGLLD